MGLIALINTYKKNEGVTISFNYFHSILKELAVPARWFQCVIGDKSQYSISSFIINGRNFFFDPISKGFNFLFTFPKEASKIESKMVFISDPWLLRIAKLRSNVVLLFHDFRQFTQFGGHFFERLLFRFLLRYMEKCQIIITPTHYTERLLIDYGCEKSKVHVIPYFSPMLANRKLHLEKTIVKLKTNKKINVLYVANDLPYKNIKFFIEIAKTAMSIDDGNFDFHLVSKLKKTNLKLIKNERISNLHIHPYIEDIRVMYEDTDILLFPSQYEGFGLPILEAMKFGIPIIANSIEPIREILGDNGVLMNSENPVEWIEALNKIASPEEYTTYSDLSYDRGKFFNKDQFKKLVSQIFVK